MIVVAMLPQCSTLPCSVPAFGATRLAFGSTLEKESAEWHTNPLPIRRSRSKGTCLEFGTLTLIDQRRQGLPSSFVERQCRVTPWLPNTHSWSLS